MYEEFLEKWWRLEHPYVGNYREMSFLYSIPSPSYHYFSTSSNTIILFGVTLGRWAISGSTDCFGCCTLGDRRVVFSRGAKSVLREACWTRASTKIVNVLVCSLLQSRSIFQDSRWWILESRMLSSAREGPTRDAAWIKIGIYNYIYILLFSYCNQYCTMIFPKNNESLVTIYFVIIFYKRWTYFLQT